MSIIQKAIKHNKQSSEKSVPVKSVDKKTVSGCYGIDNLFSNKSKKLLFSEFCTGLKDIFLACLMFIPKTFSALFGILKHPGYALSIFCTLVLGMIVMFMHDPSDREKDVPAVNSAKFISLNTPSDTKTKFSSDGSSVVVEPSNPKKNFRFSRAFETKVSGFLGKHKVSDIMCRDGCCRLKIDNNVFCEHSALCEYPKIILESSTDDELIFSDGAGNYCAMRIDSLFK